jgi:hypothetical protein
MSRCRTPRPVKVQSLTGWPEVGTTYFVPTVNLEHCGLLSDWPVFPKPHGDEIAPTLPHYHCDARFISDEQRIALVTAWEATLPHTDPIMAVLDNSALEMHNRAALWFGVGPRFGQPLPRPRLKAMVCRHAAVRWDGTRRDLNWRHFWKYMGAADEPFPAIVSNDLRPICPHQQIDLTVVWDGRESYVRCPAHGLLIDVRECRKRRLDRLLHQAIGGSGNPVPLENSAGRLERPLQLLGSEERQDHG